MESKNSPFFFSASIQAVRPQAHLNDFKCLSQRVDRQILPMQGNTLVYNE